jgi:hypothetical protein
MDQYIDDTVPPSLLEKYPRHVARNYYIENALPHHGIGHLIFANASFSEFLVVETKQLNAEARRVTRMGHRRKVKKQLLRNVQRLAEYNPGCSFFGLAIVDGKTVMEVAPVVVKAEDGKRHYAGLVCSSANAPGVREELLGMFPLCCTSFYFSSARTN